MKWPAVGTTDYARGSRLNAREAPGMHSGNFPPKSEQDHVQNSRD